MSSMRNGIDLKKMLNTIVISKNSIWVSLGNSDQVDSMMRGWKPDVTTYLTIETLRPAEDILKDSREIYKRYEKYLDD